MKLLSSKTGVTSRAGATGARNTRKVDQNRKDEIRYRSYSRLKDSSCPKAKDKKHKIWLSMLGDSKPAFCCLCGSWTSAVPKEMYENL